MLVYPKNNVYIAASFVATTVSSFAISVMPMLSPDAIAWRGNGLVRPECVLASASGDLFTADWRGGVAHLRADGAQALYASASPLAASAGRQARPNGIALRANGNFLFADLGEDDGGVFELTRGGEVREILTQVDGKNLPPSNFVTEDTEGRLWLTISTRQKPRALAYNAAVADGFIVLMDGKGARIVADGLGYTNEALVSPDGRWLYVNETFLKKLSRYPLRADGSLGSKETVTTFGHGAFPDGLAFDSEGCLWVACVVGNLLIRVLPDGSQQTVLDDGDPEYVRWVEGAYASSTLGRNHMDRKHTTTLKNISSIAFGGVDLRTVYLGCLVGDAIASFRLPDSVAFAGHPPVHWSY